MENGFITAESYIIRKKFDIKIPDLIDTDEALNAIKIAREEERDKAIEAFKKMYDICKTCDECLLPKCGEKCLEDKFKELLNK